MRCQQKAKESRALGARPVAVERLGCELYGCDVMKEMFALMKGGNTVKIVERK